MDIFSLFNMWYYLRTLQNSVKHLGSSRIKKIVLHNLILVALCRLKSIAISKKVVAFMLCRLMVRARTSLTSNAWRVSWRGSTLWLLSPSPPNILGSHVRKWILQLLVHHHRVLHLQLLHHPVLHLQVLKADDETHIPDFFALTRFDCCT